MTEDQASDVRDPSEAATTGWWDDPITDPKQDALGRKGFAKNVARLIHDNHSPASSVVYGLEGPWGSGKSSVIAMTVHYLTKVPEGRWKVVQFTPWATNGPESLLQEFFNALSTAVPDGGDRRERRRSREFRKSVSKYADVARPMMAAIPYVGQVLVETSRTIEGRLKKPWNEAFGELATDLRALDLPILVVVDDIDRLQPPELLDLLKVVRLLGRFPGVDFLLSYDEGTIVDTLQDPQRGTVSKTRARVFMEKIVQYPLSVPPLLTTKITKMLGEGLTAIVTVERAEASPSGRRLSDVLVTAMPRQLPTPRAVSRYLAQVKEQLRIHDLDEMDDVDLMLATFLRVRFPDLFAILQDWRPELTGTQDTWLITGRNDKQPEWDKLLSVVESETDRADARAVLEVLFPAVHTKQYQQAPVRRFAHPDYFNRYLTQSIPDGDIPDATISRALEAGADGDPAPLQALLFGPEYEQVMLALSKIRARYPDPTVQAYESGATPGPLTPDLIRVAMTLVDNLPERMATWTDELSTSIYWIANMTRIAVTKDHDLDLADLYSACTRLERRAHAVHIALAELDGLTPEAQKALITLQNKVAADLVPALVDDLRNQDASNSEVTGVFLYRFVLASDQKTELQEAVQSGLANGEFNVDDVAARFVGHAYVIGGSGQPSSASFTGTLFTELTGIPADSTEHNERDDWSDSDWARKRTWAMQFVNPASPGQDQDGTATGPMSPDLLR